ncbi:hypothetical protein AAG570_013449 [Ranatra chinensis]|uniref:purine-nucleoside phosphorylase n=1 Tax=Ranatra chinensis TaxID=642074 RepID=A0ABD0YC70_9HEMI
MPVRVMKLCGVTHLIASNAAGGINEEYNEGDIMIMKDHINFMGFAGNNPLVGFNDERWGPRFIPANKVYDKGLREEAKRIATKIGMSPIVREGVYVFLGGPSFETIAEINMFRICGANAVGMSTVGEALMAYHAGMKVFAFSLITNKCVQDYDDDREANHSEVLDVGAKRSGILKKWIGGIVEYIRQECHQNGY